MRPDIELGTGAGGAGLLSTHSDPSQHPLLSDLFVRSIARQMSRPDQNLHSIAWKRLQLSRAKLKASSRTSALLSGFAMVAMVECNLNDQPNPLPFGLLIAFAVCTTLLVSVHMLALMISTCILPNVEAVASMQGLVSVDESPHEKLSFYVEISWTFSTLFGILLFMIEITILCWVKFWGVKAADHEDGGQAAAKVATVLLIPIVGVFICFAVHFYRSLVSHQYEARAKGLEELEGMVTQLDIDREDSSKHGHSADPQNHQMTATSFNDFSSSIIHA